MRLSRVAALTAVATLAGGGAAYATGGARIPDVQEDDQYFMAGEQALDEAQDLHANNRRAKNVILFVGDGMGISTMTASRILEGQLAGESGEENELSFEELPYLALSKTYSANQQVPDSAPTATAMVTGVKTNDGVIGLGPDTVNGDCASSKGQELESFFMLAESRGKATGAVSTARITHATPAAVYARTPDRDWEDDSLLTDEAKANGCTDVASQLVDWPYGDGLEVALGGGRQHFLPKEQADPEDQGHTGSRADGRDLTEEWASRDGAAFVWNQEQFDAVNTDEIHHLLGLFERSHMEYEHDRPKDTAGEPSLAEMTTTAIDVLDNEKKGFALMVEGGRIDHAHHAGNAYRALTETIELSDAVRAALEVVDLRETLIVVTADHGHVFTIAGYPERGNPILGLGGVAADGLPYTTLGYANGPGSATARQGLTEEQAMDPDFLQPSLVPLGSETHSGEDVAILAAGPSAHLFHGIQEQSYIFQVVKHALGGR